MEKITGTRPGTITIRKYMIPARYKTDKSALGRWNALQTGIKTLVDHINDRIRLNTYEGQVFRSFPSFDQLERNSRILKQGIETVSPFHFTDNLRLGLEAANWFGFFFSFGLETRDYSHLIMEAFDGIREREEDWDIPYQDVQNAYKLFFMLMFSTKLCAYHHIRGILQDKYIPLASENSGQNDWYLPLFLSYLDSMRKFPGPDRFVFQRGLSFFDRVIERSSGSEFADGISAHLSRSVSGLSDRSLHEALFRSFIEDAIDGFSLKTEQYFRLKDAFFLNNEDFRYSEAVKNDLGIIRINEYSAEFSKQVRSPMVTYTGTYGKPSMRISSFSGGRRPESAFNELDSNIDHAIRWSSPVYGFSSRHSDQAPLWIIPQFNDGPFGKIYIFEMDHYYFAPDQRIGY